MTRVLDVWFLFCFVLYCNLIPWLSNLNSADEGSVAVSGEWVWPNALWVDDKHYQGVEEGSWVLFLLLWQDAWQTRFRKEELTLAQDFRGSQCVMAGKETLVKFLQLPQWADSPNIVQWRGRKTPDSTIHRHVIPLDRSWSTIVRLCGRERLEP